MKKTKILVILLIINMSILTGCWDAREINELGLVTAVGIDKASGLNRYAVTVQIANQKMEGSSSEQGKEKSEVWIGTEEGISLFDATRKLVNTSSRRVMWAHNNVVIIGESLARDGITPVIDFFTHNPELRMGAAVVVANGDAKDYIKSKIGLENIPGVAFSELERYRSITAESVESHMLQVSSELNGEYTNPLISKVSLKDEEKLSGNDSGKGGGETSKIVKLSGGAIFKKDKMVGWLSPEEMRGISWILNQTKDTIVTVYDPEHDKKSVSLETHDVEAKIETEVTNGMPKISIEISGHGHIVEEDGSTNMSMSEMKKHVAELINKEIAKDVKNGLMAVQKVYKIDCLNFAANVHVQNVSEWDNGLKDKWEEIFPEIPVTISVDIEIKNSAENQIPMNIYK